MTRQGKRHQLRLRLERLEARLLLAGDLDHSWSWFESFDDVPRIAPSELGADTSIDPATMGPHELVASEWIGQLADDAIKELAVLGFHQRLTGPGLGRLHRDQWTWVGRLGAIARPWSFGRGRSRRP